MTLIGFFRLILKKLRWLVLFPLMLAGAVIFFTRNMPKEYQSATTIYTGLASGYNITDDGTARIDNFAVNNAFDNLITTVKSRETLEEVAIKLLAQHLLLDMPDVNILGQKGFDKLNDLVPFEERNRLVVKGDFEKTVKNIYKVKDSTIRNIVQYILSNPGSFYSLSTIQGSITVMRKQSSDMLEITFKSSDPGVCLYTLKFLVEAFSYRYKGIKGGETINAVKYFEEQLQKAFEQLQNSENRLKDFGVENKIINYYEQAKFVAESKEDLSTEYYKEKMKYEAAVNALARIEEKMTNYNEFVSNNEELVNIRQQMANLSYKITNAKIYQISNDKVNEMQDQLEDLKLKLKEKARDFYNFNNSIEWVPQNTLLNQWLNKAIEIEESKGRLQVFEQRLNQYDGIYKQFAPLGSNISRLEREVSVAEKQYLSVLHGLNLARLRQQSIELSNNLKVIDNPFYPIQPLPSKRALLIAVSFIAGFILLLAYYIALELLNKSIRYPEKVESLTGLPLLSALPFIASKNKMAISFEEITQNLIQQILNSVFIELKKADPNAKNYIIAVFSTKGDEGKTFFAEQLINKLCRIKNKVLYLYPNTSLEHGKYIDANSPKIIDFAYEVNESVIDYQGIFDFIENSQNLIKNPDEVSYTVLELPRLNKYPIPASLIAKAHFNILVVHALKSWTGADKHLLNTYRQMATNSIKVLLNRVSPDLLEGIYGEIPKKRSKIRKKVKQILGGDLY
ncbi:MAG: GumC family protein [Bacteroidia bacterium]